jgi:hypothetical protein
MSIRPLLAAGVVALAGCGGSPEREELRLLAPADLVEGIAGFERETGCRVEARVYDEAEDLAAIARRRDVDVIATPVPSPRLADDAVELVQVEISGVEVTIPKRLAKGFPRPARRAGRRLTAWTIRDEGDNPACARRWIAYATSQ